MDQADDFVVQHLLKTPELINADIIEEWERIYETAVGRNAQRTQLLLLFKVVLPEGLMTNHRAWGVISRMERNISRGVQIKEKGLAPGVRVWMGDKEYIIRTIGRNFSVYLEGKSGAHHPLSVIPFR